MRYILKTHTGLQIWHRIVPDVPPCVHTGDQVYFESLGEIMTIQDVFWRVETNEVCIWLEDYTDCDTDTIEGWVQGDI